MERLTRADIDNVGLVEFENYSVHECLKDIDTVDYLNILGALMKLQDYEDLEEQGLLLKLPCKIGDTVYAITRNFISEYLICSIEKDDEGFFFNWRCKKGIYKNVWGFTDYEIGKSVFLTKEAAEKALERLEKENE